MIIICFHPVVKESLNVSHLLWSDTTTNLQKIYKLVHHLKDKEGSNMRKTGKK